MADLIVVGASGHAKVVIDIVEHAHHRVVGLVDRDGTAGKQIWEYAVLGATSELPEIATRLGVGHFVIGIGSNRARREVADAIRKQASALSQLAAIHPAAYIGRDVEIGPGSVVMAGATINSGCTVGRTCVVNTGASLDHDSTMEDYASLAPGAVTGGGCHIGEEAWIGIGAVLLQQIRIGARATVGAGATVVRNVDADLVVVGTPARPIKGAAP